MTPAEALTEVRRRDWARLVGGLTRITGDPGAAEDCVQGAFLRAWEVWSAQGVPGEPAAWVRTTAKNLALDRWRRARTEEAKVRLAAPPAPEALDPWAGDPDRDALGLLFACAHPALALEAQVALTLRWGVGLDPETIARAFLVTEETMARRLHRARTKVRQSGIPLKVPEGPGAADRLEAVLGVVYLLFNHGHGAEPGQIERKALGTEALDLASDLTRRLPAQGEVWGLEALMALTAARIPARWDRSGDLVLLEAQDRGLWDRSLMARGLDALTEGLALGPPGPYLCQAAIAACHGRAPRAEDTPWSEICLWYDRLEALAPNPVVRLNRAVARGRAWGPEAALADLGALEAEDSLAGYPYLAAAQAEFLDLAGRRAEAEAAWDRALALAPGEADRRALRRRRGR